MAAPFFQNDSVWILYRNTKIQTWCLLPEDDRIVTDIQGNIYISYWPQPEDLPKTPGKRKIYQYRKSQRAYKKFGNGLVTLQRGLYHALHSGELRILSHAEWNELLKNSQAKFEVFENLDQEDVKTLRLDLSRINRALEFAKAQPLIEAHEKLRIIVLFEDESNQFKIGSIMCRSVATYNRIQERIDAMDAWSSDFEKRISGVEKIISTFNNSLVRFIEALEKNIEFLEGTASDKEKSTYLKRRVDQYFSHFVKWANIKPYSAWTRNTLCDLEAIQLRTKYVEFDVVVEILGKLQAFTHYKLIEDKINKLIFTLSYSYDDHAVAEDLYEIKGEILKLSTIFVKKRNGSLISLHQRIGEERIKELTEIIDAVSRANMPFKLANPNSLRNMLKESHRLF